MDGPRCLIWLVIVAIHCVTHQACPNGTWVKLNNDPRCIKAKNDEYASLVYHGQPKFLSAIKFKHVSGQIRCLHATVHNSNWGCRRSIHSTLNIFLTDSKNRVIFPNKRYVTFHGRGRWYGLPGFNEISATLVMSNFANPFYLENNPRMRIWYGEDLYDESEGNNHGKVCMDVYGYLI